MFDIPVEVFFGFMGLSTVLVVLGIIQKNGYYIIMAGAFMLTMTVIIDNIITGQFVTESTTSKFPQETRYMSQETFTTTYPLRSGSDIVVGEEVVDSNSVLNGKEINQACFFIRKSGLPTGTYFVGVWGTGTIPTTTNWKLLLGSGDSAQLGAGVEVRCYRAPIGSIILSPADTVAVFYNGGNSTNFVQLQRSGANPFDGTNSHLTRFNEVSGVWSDLTTHDMQMYISFIKDVEETTNTFEDNTFPFTDMPKVLFALFSTIIILVGGILILNTKDGDYPFGL